MSWRMVLCGSLVPRSLPFCDGGERGLDVRRERSVWGL